VEDRTCITFDRSLETGDAEIDEQHRELFDRLDRLLAASRERRTREEVARMVSFLGDYVVHHFTAEDRMMTLTNYPEADPHRAEHARFVREFGALSLEFESEGPTTVFIVRIVNRVTSWLRQHIYRTDRMLVEHLKSRYGPARPAAGRLAG
jgi:hemerythrin